MFAHYILLLTALGAIDTQAGAPRCTPEPGRRAEQVRGEVIKGRPFSKSTRAGWILKLVPVEEGWFLEVAMPGREEEDLSRLTPPWHGVPNARQIEGWHLRNQDNTGPNEGDVNAPQRERGFAFVLTPADYRRAVTAVDARHSVVVGRHGDR